MPGLMSILQPRRRMAQYNHRHQAHHGPTVVHNKPARGGRRGGRRHPPVAAAAPVHHRQRRPSMGDKISGAMMKIRGSLTGRPGLKAAGTRRMRGRH